MPYSQAGQDKSDHVVVHVHGEGDSPSPQPQAAPWSDYPNAPTRSGKDDDFHGQMLHRAIADTGRYAFGTIGVEVWVMDDSICKLIRAEKGSWVDPVFALSEPDSKEALQRLTDDKPQPLSPGCGVAGALWADLSIGNQRSLGNRRVVWRQLRYLAMDPDQPYYPRAKLIVEAGCGLVGGVKFNCGSVRGIVLYFARETADMGKLTSQNNDEYLRRAADVIGSVLALKKPREVCMSERREERDSMRRRAQLKLIALVRIKGRHSLEYLPKTTQKKDTGKELKIPTSGGGLLVDDVRNTLGTTKRFILRLAKKCKGANVEPPPPMPNIQALWAFLGVLVSLLALTQFSNAISRRNPSYGLVMGPFGALMTLQYGLTAAPASQPRNAILGQVIAISIALGMTYSNLQLYLRQSLGTAIAILCMTRLGITHPPAGASALLFAGGEYNWTHMGLMLAGNVIAVCTATLINNLNDTRQYPTFWGVGYWYTHRKLMIKGKK